LFLNSQIRLAEILYGASNTVLIGEKLTAGSDLGWASGTRATLRNNRQLLSPQQWIQRGRGPDDSNAPLDFVGGFGSQHQIGSNFGLADGSVRFVHLHIDPQVLAASGNRADGAMMGNWQERRVMAGLMAGLMAVFESLAGQALWNRLSPRRAARSGFTLLELLIVMIAIPLMISMLLPAVQQVRESARRVAASPVPTIC
jgi:prepilin-type N-terminal cleavage/methylation domain-containing protein